MQDETIGNQQGKMHFNIGWLVGMVEGEGCITLSRSSCRVGKEHKIIPYLSITGTNEILMQKAAEIIRSFDLPFILVERKSKNPKHRDVFRIHVTGLMRIEKWLIFLMPYLVGKKNQAEVVLQYIQNRKKVMKLHPWFKPYSDEDLELYNKVHELNRRLGSSAKPSETKRRPWQSQVMV